MQGVFPLPTPLNGFFAKAESVAVPSDAEVAMPVRVEETTFRVDFIIVIGKY